MQITGLNEFNAFTGQKSQISVILEAFAVMLSGHFLAVSSDIKTLFHLNRIPRSIFLLAYCIHYHHICFFKPHFLNGILQKLQKCTFLFLVSQMLLFRNKCLGMCLIKSSS